MSPSARLSLVALILAAAAAPTSVAAESSTTRIEPRPYYGATITIEHGVRVYRPLPTVKHVIINPNQTPLNLSFNETTARSYNYYDPGVPYLPAPYGYWYGR
jgi:hypothetical protein